MQPAGAFPFDPVPTPGLESVHVRAAKEGAGVIRTAATASTARIAAIRKVVITISSGGGF